MITSCLKYIALKDLTVFDLEYDGDRHVHTDVLVSLLRRFEFCLEYGGTSGFVKTGVRNAANNFTFSGDASLVDKCPDKYRSLNLCIDCHGWIINIFENRLYAANWFRCLIVRNENFATISSRLVRFRWFWRINIVRDGG